jgi:putative hydrolase of the HAD superfamily
MRVEAVIFDWAGTLTPWFDIDTLGQWTTVARAINPECSEELGTALSAAERLLMKECLNEHSSLTLEQIFALAGIRLEQTVLAAYFAAWTPYTYIDPQGPDVLAGLNKRGIKVGVLSNTTWSREWHDLIFQRDGVLDLIDATVYSSEILWTKPHPEAFNAVLRALGGVKPRRSVFVGDRLFEDVYGARAVGMRTVYIPHSNIPAHELGHTDGEPDAIIQGLNELLPLIDSWEGHGVNHE